VRREYRRADRIVVDEVADAGVGESLRTAVRFPHAVIADERERKHDVVARLPLQVERVVFRVREFVGRVVAGKDERAAERDAIGGAVGRGVVDELGNVGYNEATPERFFGGAGGGVAPNGVAKLAPGGL